MFAQENREKVKLEFGFENRQLGDIAKKLGEKWKNVRPSQCHYFARPFDQLSDEEKAHYVKLSEDDKKRYEREKKELEAREESSS